MKRWLSVLLAVLLVLGVLAGSAETQAAKEAEEAAYEMAALLGNPVLLDVALGDLDAVNARFVFINNEALGCGLAVAIRISDEQMYVWRMDLTADNFRKAKVALDSSAPICSLGIYEGYDLKDSALYYGEYAAVFSYEDFEYKADSIAASLGLGDPGTDFASADPLLSLFPGISWGMTKEQMREKFGKERFADLDTDTVSSLTADCEIYGESAQVLFIFDNGKLYMLAVHCSEEAAWNYSGDLISAYGITHITTKESAMAGKTGEIEDDPDGACLAWKTDQFLIIADDTIIQYWSLP